MVLSRAPKLRLERIEPLRPERAVAGEPVVELGEWGGIERVDAPLRRGTRADEAVLAENAQVPGDGGLADREVRVQLGDVVGALREQLDDAAAGRIGEGRER